MTQILNTPKVQASGFMDIAAMGISKSATENLLTPFIGNGTFMSGALKIVGGGLVQKQGGIGKTVGGGLVIDGIDDLVSAALQRLGAGGQPAQQAWWLN